MLSGSSMVFEDFVPTGDTVALVTRGKRFRELTEIALVEYSEVNGVFDVDFEGGILCAEGENCRLGGQFDRLVYSTSKGLRGAKAHSKTAHQPFIHKGKTYYTDDWPHVRIYREDGRVVVDHWDDYIQVGNPCIHGQVMYFEARTTDAPDKPDAWEVWKFDGKEKSFVCQGANPAWWNGLIIGEWNGRGFTYKRPESD